MVTAAIIFVVYSCHGYSGYHLCGVQLPWLQAMASLRTDTMWLCSKQQNDSSVNSVLVINGEPSLSVSLALTLALAWPWLPALSTVEQMINKKLIHQNRLLDISPGLTLSFWQRHGGYKETLASHLSLAYLCWPAVYMCSQFVNGSNGQIGLRTADVLGCLPDQELPSVGCG